MTGGSRSTKAIKIIYISALDLHVSDVFFRQSRHKLLQCIVERYQHQTRALRKLFSIRFLIVAVRLVGGPDNATGRVEVYYNGTWGTVCDDYWSINDARVVCRQLGFRDTLNAYRGAHYGQGTGPIFLDNVNCLGSESSLFLCRHIGLGNHNCRHSQDASVQCENTAGEKFIFC